jgi:hypothetical protein|tara:strand:- start:3085 stop:3327 length:243 start_codon:yes stop_codon:yes gene_type:complete
MKHKKVFESLEDFFNAVEGVTEVYAGKQIGKALYSALMLQTGPDKRSVFRPRDLWEISNEDLISLLKELEEYVRVQTKNN